MLKAPLALLKRGKVKLLDHGTKGWISRILGSKILFSLLVSCHDISSFGPPHDFYCDVLSHPKLQNGNFQKQSENKPKLCSSTIFLHRTRKLPYISLWEILEIIRQERKLQSKLDYGIIESMQGSCSPRRFFKDERKLPCLCPCVEYTRLQPPTSNRRGLNEQPPEKGSLGRDQGVVCEDRLRSLGLCSLGKESRVQTMMKVFKS